MVSLKKISDKEFSVSGVVDVLFETTKTIIHEGEEYFKVARDFVPVDLIKYMDKNPNHKSCYEFFYNWLNIDYKAYYPNSFSRLLDKFSDKNYSTNEYVNILCKILSVEKNELIKEFYTSKESPKITDLKFLSIPIVLVDYGFNNKLIIEVEFKKLISLDWSTMDDEVKIQLEHIFFETQWSNRFTFWKYLIPQEIFNRPLTLDEKNFVLMELYQRKVKLFSEAKRHYLDNQNRTNYIIQKLN